MLDSLCDRCVPQASVEENISFISQNATCVQILGTTCRRCEDTVGAGYTGTVSRTRRNELCKAWTLTEFANVAFPDGCASSARNYCRNPNRRSGGPWCYIATPSVPALLWDFCDVNTCSTCTTTSTVVPPTCATSPTAGAGVDCLHTGQTYLGDKSNTTSGRTCQVFRSRLKYECS